MNQRTAVLAHLQKFGTITSWEAIEKFGATRLSDIIYDLRKAGYKIENLWETHINRFGTPSRIVRYIYQGREQRAKKQSFLKKLLKGGKNDR